MMDQGEAKILESWKEIASYLKRTVRTCCRWEEDLGLPVHRLDGSPRARVYAYKEELDRWLREKLSERGKQDRQRKRLWLKLAFGIILLVALSAASLFMVKGIPRNHSPAAGNGQPVLAVLPILNDTGDADLDHVCRFFQRRLNAELRPTHELMTVISEPSVNEALLRLKLTGKRDYARSDLRSIAKRVSANHVLIGRLSNPGTKWRIVFDIVETGRLRVVGNGYVDGTDKHQGLLAGKLAGKILSELNLPYDQDTNSWEWGDPLISPQASRFYGEAVKAEWTYTSFHDENILQRAMEFYRKALAVDPSCALAHVGLGNLYQLQYVFFGEREEFLESMVRHYLKAHELAPDLAEANLGLGWISFFNRDNDEAFAHFQRAFELDPSSAFVNYDIGAFFGSVGLLEAAVEFLSRAIDAGERSASVYRVRAHYLEQMGDYEGAVRDSKKLCEMEPGNCGVRCFHARILLMMKEYEEAKVVLEVAEILDSKHPHVRLVRALMWAAGGEKDKALEAAAPALEDPIRYTYLLSQIYASVGLADEALGIIEQGLKTGFEETQTYAYPYALLNNWDNYFYDNLRGHPRFRAILEREKKTYDDRRQRFGEL